jgi:hypothetical protein
VTSLEYLNGCLDFLSIVFKVGAVQMVKPFTTYAKFSRVLNLGADVTGKI